MEAFVTLTTTDEYALGALVLAHSLREVETKKKLVCMITKTVSDTMRNTLAGVFDHIELVDVMNSEDEANLNLLARPDLGITFTKLHCWRLTQYSKCVFMDADTLVMQNIDDLFEREELSASPDPGWPDCFNSGVFVFSPSQETYKKLLAHATTTGSFDGGDQGLLNTFFSDWSTNMAKHLRVTDNCMSVAFYSYIPAFVHHRGNIRVAHFIGMVKPWHQTIDPATGQVIPRDETGKYSVQFLNHWWRIFMNRVRPNLDSSLNLTGFIETGGLVEELLKIKPPTSGPIAGSTADSSKPMSAEQSQVHRQMAWERGEIDYTGSDRFDKIASKLDSVITKK